MSGYGDDEGYAEYMEERAAEDEAAWQASESARAEAEAAAANEAAQAATSEPDHTHVCPACGDTWLHADSDCEVVYPARTWALCPIHRGGDDA